MTKTFGSAALYGAITLPTEATEPEEALRIADQRLYACKHAGRVLAARQVTESLQTVLGACDPELVRHARAVAELAEATARELALGHRERETIRLAAELNDAGRVLLAREPSKEEIALAGERMIASVAGHRPRRSTDRRAGPALGDDADRRPHHRRRRCLRRVRLDRRAAAGRVRPEVVEAFVATHRPAPFVAVLT